MTSLALLQAILLAAIVMGSFVYAYGRRKKHSILPRVVASLLGLYALGSVVVALFLWQNHAAFPLNLEAMEGVVLEHLRRVLAGQPIYSEPTVNFVALAYNPPFYLVAAPFAGVFGASLFTLRLVAVLGALGAGAIVCLAVRRETGSWWWALVAVGLFGASYRAMDCYLDVAHSDSWMLFCALLACYLADRATFRGMNVPLALVAALLAAASFWFKQSGAIFALGVGSYLIWRVGVRRAWPSELVLALLGPVLFLFAPTELLGSRFHYFTLEVPRQWVALDWRAIERLSIYILRHYAVLAGFAVAFAAEVAVRDRRRANVWMATLPFAVLSGISGVMDSESNNNVLIPLAVWLIICGVLGVRRLGQTVVPAERLGAHILAFGLSFVLLADNPSSLIVSPDARASYVELQSYLRTLDGTVYAPWLGQLPDGYRLQPTAHWVPLTDIVRGNGHHEPDTQLLRQILEPVARPSGSAYLLMNYPLEEDSALAYLATDYVLDTDLGDRFRALATLPRRFDLHWPRYLYRYSPAAVR